MERGDNGKFIKSATPAASTSGKDASGTGENAYEEPVELLATPVAVTSMPALPPGAGTTGAEDAPIKNDDSADGFNGNAVRFASTPNEQFLECS